jgi:hypothetical protein
VWLCQTCGKLADNDQSSFTIEELRRWKRQAEADAFLDIGRPPAASGDSVRSQQWAFFEKLRGIRDRITSSALPEPSDIALLQELREESSLRFGVEITEYIEQWINHAAALRSAHSVLADPYSQPAHRKKWVDADNEALLFFAKQYRELARTFKPYIGTH